MDRSQGDSIDKMSVQIKEKGGRMPCFRHQTSGFDCSS